MTSLPDVTSMDEEQLRAFAMLDNLAHTFLTPQGGLMAMAAKKELAQRGPGKLIVKPHCTVCNGRERVCENHPGKAWPKECDCGAGMPCICSPLYKHQPKQEQNAMNTDQFIEDAAFAKRVSTKDGPAIRIGSHILHVTGPKGADWVDLLVNVLRTLDRPEVTAEDMQRISEVDQSDVQASIKGCQETYRQYQDGLKLEVDPAAKSGIEVLKGYAKRWTGVSA